jgi:diacylglycerol kinase family enzyme
VSRCARPRNPELDSGSNVRIQLDGEPAGYAPLVLGVRDNALAVVLPLP